MDCGSRYLNENERVREYTYAEYRIFGDLSLILCNFCHLDFGSYDPTFFGLPRGTRLELQARDWTFVRDVQPFITQDKCCVRCGYRLPFLEFVARARELHSEDKELT
jgi:hypothetical protein